MRVQRENETARNLRRGLERKGKRKLGAVIPDSLNRTAFFGFFAAGFFFRILWLLGDERVAAVLIAFEILRRSLAAKIAVDALIIDVIFSSYVFWIFICDVSHKISC